MNTSNKHSASCTDDADGSSMMAAAMKEQQENESTIVVPDNEEEEDMSSLLLTDLIQQQYPGMTPSSVEVDKASTKDASIRPAEAVQSLSKHGIVPEQESALLIKGDPPSKVPCTTISPARQQSKVIMGDPPSTLLLTSQSTLVKGDLPSNISSSLQMMMNGQQDDGVTASLPFVGPYERVEATMALGTTARTPNPTTTASNAPGAYAAGPVGGPESRALVLRPNIRKGSVTSLPRSENSVTELDTEECTLTTSSDHCTIEATTANNNNNNDLRLVQANPVLEHQDLPQATPMQRGKRSARIIVAATTSGGLLGIGCMVLAVATVLTFVFASMTNNNEETTSGDNQLRGESTPGGGALASTNTTTSGNHVAHDLAKFLPPHSIQAIEQDHNSPQHQAYLWLVDDPYRSAYSNARLLQRFALATIYHALGGLEWTHAEGWLSYEIHECDWLSKGGYGFDLFSNDEELVDALSKFDLLYRQVGPTQAMTIWAANVYPDTPPPICDKQDQYTKLYLYNNNLVGQIPEELYLLTTLQSMDIGVNVGIQGTLSTNIGQLQQLQFFWLMRLPVLTGTLPTELGLLTNIKLFNMQSSMDGPLPSELGNMQSLVDMRLPRSKFTGTIPVELTKLTRLSRLILARNALTGSFPSEIGLMTNLRVLLLDSNLFTGSMPTELGQLSKLNSYTVHSGLLTGTLPKEIAQWTNLIYAELNDNHLSGQLPAAIGQWTQLLTLQVANNMFTGSLPGELALLTALEELDVSSNSFVGEVPLELDQLSQLKIFNLQANDLTSVPQLSLVHNLTHLHLDSNPSLGGSVNDFLLTNATFPLLQAVTLANTGLTGELPMQLCPIEELIYDCSPQLCGCNCSCSS